MKEFYEMKRYVVVDNLVERYDSIISWVPRENKPNDKLHIATVDNYRNIPWGMTVIYGKSFWKQRPYVRVHYWWEDSKRYYLDKHAVHLKTEWNVATKITVKDIIQNASAEDAIEYFKERGLTVCPMERK